MNCVLILIILMVMYQIANAMDMTKNRERFASTNSEAIAAVAALYNKDNMTLTNAHITDKLTVGSLNILPRGIVTMWNGTTAPKGWALCDGRNGTPNLKDRFILGAGRKKVGNRGGEETHRLSIGEMPAHSHNQYTNNRGQNNGEWSQGGLARLMVGDRSGGFWHANFSAHLGGNQAHNNMPPYYTMAFIMKL